jgi:hypothetical protein
MTFAPALAHVPEILTVRVPQTVLDRIDSFHSSH